MKWEQDGEQLQEEKLSNLNHLPNVITEAKLIMEQTVGNTWWTAR